MMKKRIFPFRKASDCGMTMIELMVACAISLVFIMAAGTGYIVNQKAFRANKEKLELQQTASRVMEIMERKIREGATVTVPNSKEIHVFDKTGIETTSFSDKGGGVRVYEQNTMMADLLLTQLEFKGNSTNSDNRTVVQIKLGLQDRSKNVVALMASATLHNHFKLRNIDKPGP